MSQNGLTNRAPRNRRRRNRRGGRSRMEYSESFSFSIEVGKSINITVANLANRPPRSNFRPISMTVSAITAYIPPNVDYSHFGAFIPSAIQLNFGETVPGSSSTFFSASTGPRVLGMTPSNVTLWYPRSEDWYSYQVNSATRIATIDTVCLGNSSIAAYVRGICHFRVRIGPEVVEPTCPTLQHLESRSDDEYEIP